ncbi:MAG: aquaporin [Candidatus Dormibacter sp.]
MNPTTRKACERRLQLNPGYLATFDLARRLSVHDTGQELLENAVATAAALVVIILVFGSLSGAHFNRVITLADVLH